MKLFKIIIATSVISLSFAPLLATNVISDTIGYNLDYSKGIDSKLVDNIVNNNPSSLSDLKKMTVEEISNLSKFDGRELNIVTPVKDQGAQGICWAYSMAAASETNMLYQTNVLDSKYNNTNFNLSSKSIDNTVNKRNGNHDKLGLTPNDIVDNNLGNGVLSMFTNAQLLLQQNGPVIAKDNNYNNTTGETAAWLESIVTIPNDVDQIKKAISKYGAVSFSYKESPTYTNYYTKDTRLSHAATIIGWDDNFDKSKFQPSQPSRNGAWIVKNSWGDKRYDKGYFYLSYDSYINDIIAFNYVNKNTYENIYYYDGLGRLEESSEIGNKKTAVIFPVKKGSKEVVEKLKGITFALSGKNASVKATIYQNADAKPSDRHSKINNPENGIKIHEQQSEIYPNATQFGGNYTMRLSKEIELQPDSYFSIVLEPINADNSAKLLFSSETRSENDLTFFKRDNSWINCADANIGDASYYVAAIKALTVTENRNQSTLANDLAFANANYQQDIIYNGTQINQSPLVSLNNNNLAKGTDFVVDQRVVADNLKNGDYELTLVSTIKGINAYKGEKKIYTKIQKGLKPNIDLGNLGSYDESTNIVNISVSENFNNRINNYSDIKLPLEWEFENKGELVVGENRTKIKYIGKDAKMYQQTSFDVVVNKSINTIDINGSSLKNEIGQFEYNGNQIKPNIDLTFNNKELVLDKDYTISYANNVNAGIASITITGLNYFTGMKNITFNINKKDVPKINLGSLGSYDEKTNIITINVNETNTNKFNTYKDISLPNNFKFKNEEMKLNEGVNANNKIEYVGSDANNYNKTLFDVIVNKKVISEIPPEIPNEIDISTATISLANESYEYTGNEIKPIPRLTINNKQLNLNSDYTLTYSNNVNAGQAKITIVGKGEYTGIKEIDFTIKKANNKITSFYFNDKEMEVESKFGSENVEYWYYSSDDFNDGTTIMPTINGIYYIRAFIPGNENYFDSWSDVSIKIRIHNNQIITHEFHNSGIDSPGIISGITIGVIVLLLIIIAVAIVIIKTNRKNKKI